jgi:HPt (histidine-containing phosphotransfer) domain-containing protein
MGREADSPVDMHRLYEVTSDNPEKVRRIVGKYIEQAEETFTALQQAIQKGASADVHFLAHRLGGASSACGMVALVPPLSRIEQIAGGGQSDGLAEACAEAARQFERIRQCLDNHLQHLAECQTQPQP